MKTVERDSLLFILAITSGSADGWSYMGLGHVFVANMTGNTVLLGMAIFDEPHNILHPVISLAWYAGGVAIGSLLTHKVKEGSLWSRSVAGVLFLEALLMISAAVGWMRCGAKPNPRMQVVLLSCVAAGIGLQSGAMLALKLPGIITTYITGTWTTLVSGVVRIGSGDVRGRRNQADFEDRLLIQIGFLASYFLSAVVTGWMLHYAPSFVGGLTSISILLVVAYGALRH